MTIPTAIKNWLLIKQVLRGVNDSSIAAIAAHLDPLVAFTFSNSTL